MAGYRIILADDHPLFRSALAHTLRPAFPDAEIGEVGTLGCLLDRLTFGDDVDLILLDLEMPGAQGLSGLVSLRTQFPAVPVAIVSANIATATMRQCLDFGAFGYIPKSTPSEQVRAAVQSILNGSVWLSPDYDVPAAGRDLTSRISALTPQQRRVLMLLLDGLLNKQIAFELDVSEATIKAHVSAILQKLNVDSRTQAVISMSGLLSSHVKPADLQVFSNLKCC
jgi:DNA-binding NarL/FixJ family response regulator